MHRFLNLPGGQLDPEDSINDDLIGWWRLNEGAGGKVNDLSPYRNRGTLTNIVQGPTSGWIGGNLGGAVLFDGSNDYIDVENTATLFDAPASGTGTLSICFWFRTTTASATLGIISKGAPTGGAGWCIFINSTSTGMIRCLVRGSIGATVVDRVTTSTNLNNGLWHFAVVIMKLDQGTTANNDVQIFIDGALNQGALTGPSNPALAVSDRLGIAARAVPSGPLGFFPGSLANVRGFARQLNVQEIESLYAEPLRGLYFPTRPFFPSPPPSQLPRAPLVRLQAVNRAGL
jgi:hypothetical protein